MPAELTVLGAPSEAPPSYHPTGATHEEPHHSSAPPSAAPDASARMLKGEPFTHTGHGRSGRCHSKGGFHSRREYRELAKAWAHEHHHHHGHHGSRRGECAIM